MRYHDYPSSLFNDLGSLQVVTSLGNPVNHEGLHRKMTISLVNVASKIAGIYKIDRFLAEVVLTYDISSAVVSIQMFLVTLR